MKISTYIPQPIPPASKADPKADPKVAERTLSSVDGASLSAEARWINAIKEEAKKATEVRADLVQQTRDAVAAGTFEASVDMDTLVTNFLADL